MTQAEVREFKEREAGVINMTRLAAESNASVQEMADALSRMAPGQVDAWYGLRPPQRPDPDEDWQPLQPHSLPKRYTALDQDARSANELYRARLALFSAQEDVRGLEDRVANLLDLQDQLEQVINNLTEENNRARRIVRAFVIETDVDVIVDVLLDGPEAINEEFDSE